MAKKTETKEIKATPKAKKLIVQSQIKEGREIYKAGDEYKGDYAKQLIESGVVIKE